MLPTNIPIPELFANAALQIGADRIFAEGSRLMAVYPGVPEEIPISPGEMNALKTSLGSSFPDSPTLDIFFSGLAEGCWNGHGYDTENGRYWGTDPDSPIGLSKEDIFSRQNPIHPDLRRLSEGNHVHILQKTGLPLSVAGVFMENFSRIERRLFDLSVSFVLRSLPRTRDSVYLHAGSGAIGRYAISGALHVSSYRPDVKNRPDDSERTPPFPTIKLNFDGEGSWIIGSRCFAGASEAYGRILNALLAAPWGIVPAGAPSKTGNRESPLSDLLANPHGQTSSGIPRNVAVTQPGVQVADLSRIPKESFEKAVYWCLGDREPRQRDRIFLTAGSGFSRGDRVNHCLLFCPSIPTSRNRQDYPRVWIRYEGSRWVIEDQSVEGEASRKLIEAVTTHTDWGLTRTEPRP